MMDDLLSHSGLTIIIDFSSLADYVSLIETKKLVDDFGLEVHWLPLVKSLESRSLTSSENDPLSAYKARRTGAREKFAREELERNCEYMGIAVEQAAMKFDSTHVALGQLWLKEAGASAGSHWRYADLVFSRVFRGKNLIETAQQVSNLLVDSGIDVSGFTDFLDKNELPTVQQALLDAGVFDSPAIIFQGERYIGRQHHPLLRWILGGSKGMPPV